MIPKTLYFIWITEKNSVSNLKPTFANYSKNIFQKLNPDWTIVEIDDTNPIVDECRQYINAHNIMFEQPLFSDILRLYVVFKYGGLYLDYDCFPIKKFDDTLLHYQFLKSSNDVFAVGSIKRPLSQLNNLWYNEMFIKKLPKVGFFPNYNYFINPTYKNGAYKTIFNKNNCIELKDKFWNNSLQLGERIEPNSNDPMYYFDHYRMSVWNDCTISIKNSTMMKQLKL